jgi:hypothetical protein
MGLSNAAISRTAPKDGNAAKGSLGDGAVISLLAIGTNGLLLGLGLINCWMVSRSFPTRACGLGKPGENKTPSAPANIKGGCDAERMPISIFSSYSIADSGYSNAVTMSSSADSMETEFQKAFES